MTVKASPAWKALGKALAKVNVPVVGSKFVTVSDLPLLLPEVKVNVCPMKLAVLPLKALLVNWGVLMAVTVPLCAGPWMAARTVKASPAWKALEKAVAKVKVPVVGSKFVTVSDLPLSAPEVKVNDCPMKLPVLLMKALLVNWLVLMAVVTRPPLAAVAGAGLTVKASRSGGRALTVKASPVWKALEKAVAKVKVPVVGSKFVTVSDLPLSAPEVKVNVCPMKLPLLPMKALLVNWVGLLTVVMVPLCARAWAKVKVPVVGSKLVTVPDAFLLLPEVRVNVCPTKLAVLPMKALLVNWVGLMAVMVPIRAGPGRRR